MFHVEPWSFAKPGFRVSYDACLRGENCIFFWTKVQEGRVFVVDRTSKGWLWIYWEPIDSILAFWFQVPDPTPADERRAVIAFELVESSDLSFAQTDDSRGD